MDPYKDIYATLPRRVKASIIDGIVLFALFILIPMAVGTFDNNETPIKAILMFAPLFLLEPFLITYWGCTLGQYIFGMQVVRIDTRLKCPLLVSFARYYTKLLLGSLSLIYMLFSGKHQAIHDHLTKTIVLLSSKKIERNPEFASQGVSEQIFEVDYVYPSPLRRFGIFVLWYILVSILWGILIEGTALLALPGYTIDTETLPKHIDTAVDFLSAIIFILMAILASKGYLPGAKRKKREIDTTE